jgi:Putative beta-barrel porin-2, OmpL-like. bbp2
MAVAEPPERLRTLASKSLGKMMKRIRLAGLFLIVAGGTDAALAADAPAGGAAATCTRIVDPYTNYACLEPWLGMTYWERLVNYYRLEWGHDAAPVDPKAPPSRRPESEVPPTPQSIPPYPFTEWPYGGTTNLGVTRPSSVDSPLMAALGNTTAGQWMNDNHIQIYGWLDPGGNLSTSTVKGGNAPAAYSYNPNTVQLDQAVIYIERLPDTVQKDHIDWGFRFAPIYGENYRYTTAYGLFSSQFLNQNLNNGFDIPMAYGEVFIPQVLDGLMIRFGRYISIPDIEAQLAPNNYMYSHSMTYVYDNYTNTGVGFTLAANKNWILQLGVSTGTEALPWHVGATIANPDPNPLYPGTTMLKDPGATPSVTAGVRWTSNDGNDDVNVVANGINGGQWGYNNLQWFGVTYYHKFNDQWHIAFESYNEHQNNVPNALNPLVVNTSGAGPLGFFQLGGTPFSPQYMPFNAPNLAQCSSATALSCTASFQTFLLYVNDKITPLDNLTWRGEFVDDYEGQRTGTKTRYLEAGFGWQHWFSPQIEIRPEVSYYRSLDAFAFNGNSSLGIAPNKNFAIIGSADMIIHF